MNDKQQYNIDQILQEMRDDYWQNLEIETDGASSGEDYLVVRIAGKLYALRAALCDEVLKMPKLVRVPRLPRHFCGIFNLRGEIVAVTDLRPLFDIEAQEVTSEGRLVVVASGPLKTALLVDAVEGLKKVEKDQIEPLSKGADSREIVDGKVVEGAQTMIILDIARLLARPDLVIDQKGSGVSGAS